MSNGIFFFQRLISIKEFSMSMSHMFAYNCVCVRRYIDQRMRITNIVPMFNSPIQMQSTFKRNPQTFSYFNYLLYTSSVPFRFDTASHGVLLILNCICVSMFAFVFVFAFVKHLVSNILLITITVDFCTMYILQTLTSQFTIYVCFQFELFAICLFFKAIILIQVSIAKNFVLTLSSV